MKEYDMILYDVVKKVLNNDIENIDLPLKVKNMLDINLYILLLNINKKQFKYTMDFEEEKIILEFIKLLNNFKVQVELNRRPIHLEQSASKVLDFFYKNEDMLLIYLDDNVEIEDILLTADIKELDNLVIELSQKKAGKDKLNNEKNQEVMLYTKLLLNNDYKVDDDIIIFNNNNKISMTYFKELFNYLINLDNYEFSYKNNRIKNLQLNIVTNVISNINDNNINLNKISTIIIPLLLLNVRNKKTNLEDVDFSSFKIENISINDLLNNKKNKIMDNMAKVHFGDSDIALSNVYLFNKIVNMSISGKYYFNDDLFVVDDREFKCSISINKMIDYLFHII